jgi:hypothetical protein
MVAVTKNRNLDTGAFIRAYKNWGYKSAERKISQKNPEQC